MKNIPKPLTTFRIFPTYRGFYLTVFVWRTLADFRAANPGNSHALGLCRGELRINCAKGKKERVIPSLGEIHLSKRHLRIGIITHEITHAAMRWAERANVRLGHAPICRGQHSIIRQKDPEERFCHALGNMTAQMIAHLYKTKMLS